MPEWWTYSLSDFLLFSPRTYYRLLQRYNEALWPVQILTLGLGFTIVALLRRPSPGRDRLISTIIAALWAFVAWAFLWNRYALINWAAAYAVPLFLLEALFLLWVGSVQGRMRYRPRRTHAGVVGTSLLLVSLVIYPLLAIVSGRPWPQAEVFGIAPDPTALATLALFALVEGASRPTLITVPVLWCLFSGATLLAMGSPEAWVQLLAPFMLLGVIAWSRRWKTVSL